VTLADQNASVVDALGQTELEDTRLQAALEEVLDLERKHVVELHA
jgi:nucleoside-triphosphatase THEP1